MLPPIAQDDVFFLLEPMIGLPLLLRHSELVTDITESLRAFRMGGEMTLEEVHERISSVLFNGIYADTKGKMVVKDAQGAAKKIYTDDLAQMTESLMEPVIARMPKRLDAYEMLNDYALRHLSLPALKRLYLDFEQFTPEMNRTIFVRVIVENFGKERYEGWMRET